MQGKYTTRKSKKSNPPQEIPFAPLDTKGWHQSFNAYTERLMGWLSGSEIKVFLHVLRHTTGFSQPSARISIQQFCTGVVVDKKIVDIGTQLSAEAVRNGLEALIALRVIAIVEPAVKGANLPAGYAICPLQVMDWKGLKARHEGGKVGAKAQTAPARGKRLAAESEYSSTEPDKHNNEDNLGVSRTEVESRKSGCSSTEVGGSVQQRSVGVCSTEHSGSVQQRSAGTTLETHMETNAKKDTVKEAAAAAKPAGVQDLGENAVRDRAVSGSQQQQDTGDLEQAPNAVPAKPTAPVYVLPGDEGHPRFPEWRDDLTTDLTFREWLARDYPEEVAAYLVRLAVAVPAERVSDSVFVTANKAEPVKKGATPGTTAVSDLPGDEDRRLREAVNNALNAPGVRSQVLKVCGQDLTTGDLDALTIKLGHWCLNGGKITVEMVAEAGRRAKDEYNACHKHKRPVCYPSWLWPRLHDLALGEEPAGTEAPTSGTEQATRRTGGREDERRAEAERAVNAYLGEHGMAAVG